MVRGRGRPGGRLRERPIERRARGLRQVDRVDAAEAERQLDGLQPGCGQRGEPLAKMRLRQHPAAIVRRATAPPDDGLRGAQLALELLTKSQPDKSPSLNETLQPFSLRMRDKCCAAFLRRVL